MTTPYTPTTEIVWEWIEQDTLPGMRDEIRAQFERWLADHDAKVLEAAAEWSEGYRDESLTGWVVGAGLRTRAATMRATS